MDKWAINVQYKNRVIHKIRPATWYGNNNKYPLFKSLEHYLSAIEETLFSYPDTHELAKGWRKKVADAYHNAYGVKISIPRWEDIEVLYKPKNK